MSLFGTSPSENPTAQVSSLFDDGSTPRPRESQSLFADDNDNDNDDNDNNDHEASAWNLPTPKKTSRTDLVKTMLSPSEVPESYGAIYDALLASDRMGAGVSLTGVRKVLEAGQVPAELQTKILDLVLLEGAGGPESGRNGVSPGQVYVLQALIGLAQENEDITLDGVDERRRNLPLPSLPSFHSDPNPSDKRRVSESNGPPSGERSKEHRVTASSSSSLDRPPNRHNDTLEFPETDPWSSPALHKGHHHHGSPSNATPKANGTPADRSKVSEQGSPSRDGGRLVRGDPGLSPGSASVDQPRRNSLHRRESGGWSSIEGSSNHAFASPPGSNPGLAGSNRADDLPRGRDLSGGYHGSTGPARVGGNGAGEVVTITLLPEKEGIFMFQHRNYQISSTRKNTKVVRRYSDFVWLLNCLHKRYPFRQLPLLPPKRVAVNGNHLLSDPTFLERRRRGLTRFTNALVRHPVLSQEQLVVMFLTVPTELAVWRKQATISVQEEFVGRSLPPALEDSLPPTLSDTFDTVRGGVRRSLELYVGLCALIDRLARRKEGVAADDLRLSLALQSLMEVSESTYAVDTSDVPLLNAGLQATARHITTSQSLLDDEARTWDEGVLEDLKRQRDALASVRDMFDRRDRLAKNNIPALERRIHTNETRLANLRDRPEGSVKSGELEKVEEAIIQDKQSIVAQHARGVFIKECLRDELNYFQSSQHHVGRLHQDWSQERVKYAELQTENWKSLSEELEEMPSGD